MHLTLEVGAGLYGEALVCNVGHDLGALSETDGLGLHPSADSAKNPHCLGHSGAIDLPLFPDGGGYVFHAALPEARSLDQRVFRSLEQAEKIISQQLARKRKPT